LIALIVPPTVPHPKHKSNQYFTVNHILKKWFLTHIIRQQIMKGVSEFSKTNLKKNTKKASRFLYKGSPVQLYCKYVNEYYIENDTVHIIASIESFLMKTWGKRWLVTNRKGNVVAINGLDGYCLPVNWSFWVRQEDTPTKSFLNKSLSIYLPLWINSSFRKVVNIYDKTHWRINIYSSMAFNSINLFLQFLIFVQNYTCPQKNNTKELSKPNTLVHASL
jgi:hypothetical protein